MIVEPPIKVGAVHEILACLYPAVTFTLVGAAGVVTGGVGVCEKTEFPAPTVRLPVTPLRSVIVVPEPSLKS